MRKILWNDSTLGAVKFPARGWTTYDSVSFAVSLKKGLNVFNLASIFADGGPNVDEFEFNVEGVRLWKDSDSTSQTTAVRFGRNASPASLRISDGQIFFNLPSMGTLAVFDLNGNIVLKKSVEKAGTVAEWGALPRGRYMVTLIQGNRFVAKSFVNKL